jgi:hemolysin III
LKKATLTGERKAHRTMTSLLTLLKDDPNTDFWCPQQRRVEWAADVLVHVLGLMLAIVGSFLMLHAAAVSGSLRLSVALVIYTAGLLAMLTCSLLYNSNTNRQISDWLEKLDLSAIFIMIAGSYTPFMLGRLEGPLAWGVLGLVWIVALTGVGLNLLARWYAPRVYIALYLLLGWAVLAVIDQLVHALSPLGLTLLAAGGALYTIGVGFHVNKKLPFNSAIWHGFVVAASACHFAAIYLDVAIAAV